MTELTSVGTGSSYQKMILDLIGPFVVHFLGGIARIHAPLCQDHHANLLTDSNDIPLSGLPSQAETDRRDTGFIYTLRGPDETGPREPGSAFDCVKACTDPDSLLLLSHKQAEIDPAICHLLLKAPRPDRLVPLRAEQTWIHSRGAQLFVNTVGEDDETVDEERARGLRFIYLHSLMPRIELEGAPQSTSKDDIAAIASQLSDLKADALGFQPPQYHVTLRYASNSAQDEHHNDAYECFRNMRKLIPKTLAWRVDFEESPKTQQWKSLGAAELSEAVGGKKPHDCGAALLVVPE